MLKKLRRLNNYSSNERLLLLQLFALSVAVVAALRWFPLNRLVDFFSSSARGPLLRYFPLLHERLKWGRLMALADTAARLVRGENCCLVRALLLFWLLKVRQELAELVIGVSKEASDLKSHAWIESRGTVIGESATTVGHFASMLRF